MLQVQAKFVYLKAAARLEAKEVAFAAKKAVEAAVPLRKRDMLAGLLRSLAPVDADKAAAEAAAKVAARMEAMEAAFAAKEAAEAAAKAAVEEALAAEAPSKQAAPPVEWGVLQATDHTSHSARTLLFECTRCINESVHCVCCR